MNTEQMRIEFEAWAKTSRLKDSLEWLEDNGCYSKLPVQSAYEAWQAALQAKSVPDGWILSCRYFDKLEKEYENVMFTTFNAEQAKHFIEEPFSENGCYIGQLTNKPIEDIKAEPFYTSPQPADKVRELEKDAARYRWLRKTGGIYKNMNVMDEWNNDYDAPDSELDETIDKAIDEAMKGE